MAQDGAVVARNESKVAEMMIPKEKAVPESEVVESVARETPAGKGSASDASCSGHDRAAAGDHASLEAHSAAGKASRPGCERASAGDHPSLKATARESGEMRSAATETAAAKMHSPAAKAAVHAAEPAERHRWAWKGNCRSEQGCGERPRIPPFMTLILRKDSQTSA